MCRLGGVVLTNRPRTVDKYRQISEDLLGMLVKMEDALGGDGNSLTFHYPNGTYRIIKEHRKVNRLFSRFNDIQKNLMDGAIIVQMHARLSTCGPSEKHENMHPFVHGDIIGCHNGQINDAIIWDELEREHYGVVPYSTTDSEAMFAAMSIYAPTLRPKGLQSVLDILEGTYAITAVSKKEPNMLALIAGENPLAYWNNKKEGEFWYASTPSLFPETLNIPYKKVKKKYTYGKNKGKFYTTTVRNIIELDEGDGLYVRASKRRVSIEKCQFDTWRSYFSTQFDDEYGLAWNDEYYGWTNEELERKGSL